MEESKLLAFEYIISKLIEWYKSLKNEEPSIICSNFSKLKIFKLHFFVSAVNSQKISETQKPNDLLTVFDRFYALPYGPVEGQIYDNINDLKMYSIYNDHISINENLNSSEYFRILDSGIRTQIDDAIKELKNTNNELVTYPPFDLVEISHKWPVWKLSYAYALRNGRRNEFMPSELIRASSQFYS